MRTGRLGCLSLSGIIAVVVTLLLLTGLELAQGGAMFSPGDLNNQTGPTALGGVLSHADTGKSCKACHTAFWENERMADRCILCHIQLISNPQDFHGVMLAQSRQLSCMECHTDHKGADADLTIYKMERFPHNDAGGYSLKGHKRLVNGQNFACRDCHGQPIEIFEPATCIDCHLEIDNNYMAAHQGAFGDGCLECHDGKDTYGPDFDHNKLGFRLEGGHADVECVACHENARALADLIATSQDCISCHLADDPHEGLLGTQCAECHNSMNWDDVTFDHNRSAFPLIGEHLEVACDGCHLDLKFKGTGQICYSCHLKDDSHEGQFGQQCDRCHTPQDWEDIVFDHSDSSFPLQGAHSAVACLDCHNKGTLDGTPQDCFSCHAGDDAHQGSLGNDCSVCHTTEDWKDVTFDHSQSKYPLTGSHTKVDCVGCHQGGVFVGTPTDCYGCHAGDDPHAGSLGKDCAACHITEAWDKATFDHARSAFPLTGAHLGLSCGSCHSNLKFRGISNACVSCHAEPAYHRGMFGTSCESCHNTGRWIPAKYGKGHRFPLSHGGARKDCRTCHPDKLSGYTCFDCHNRGETIKKHQEEGIGDINNCVRCHPNGEGGDDGGGGDDD